MVNNKNKKLEFHWKREYSFFYGITALYGLADFAREELKKEIAVYMEGKSGWISIYSSPIKELLLKKVATDFLKRPKHVSQKIHELFNSGEKLLEFTKTLKQKTNISLPQSKILYERYFELLKEYCIHLWRSFYYADLAPEIIKRVLEKYFKNGKLQNAFERFSIPSRKAGVLLISDFFSRETKRQKRIDFIQKRFPWLACTDQFSRPFSLPQVKHFIDSFEISEKKKMPDLSRFNSVEKQFIKIYREIIFLKDKRDEYRRKAYYLAFPFVESISKNLSVPFADLAYLVPHEIFSNDKNEIKKKIKQRKENFFVWLNLGKINIISGDGAKKFFITRDGKKDIKEFKGIVGSGGKAQGKARLIKSEKDIDKVKKGEIIVAITTNPTYIAAMQKAVAFITDEGGITCHAAIIAREMNKPCVIGTKIATKVLKDGDLVEVDADKGIIKILKEK